MNKRSISIGGYNTAADGLWTLGPWSFSPAVHAQNIVTVPGSSIPLDLSTALTDGEPVYNPRTFEATLESSEGDRLARKARIDEMVNQLDGRRFSIVLPDDPDKYITGRVSVAELYNDLAHASVRVTAICDPWKYNQDETVVSCSLTGSEHVTLVNDGRMPVVPVIEVEEEDVSIVRGAKSWTLNPGKHQLPDLLIKAGEAVELVCEGAGVITFTYREASI